jgi:colicin import membrane protein
MKKLLGALALSLALVIAPMHAATEITTVVKERKTAAAKRKIAEKKAAARKKAQERRMAEERAEERKAKARKDAKTRTKHVEKEPARAQRKPAKGPYRTTIVHNTDDKVVGHTEEGREIYEGPRGGHYYLTESGNKEYVKTMYAR